jgi:multisubunit Na+/H+ antiporter MnhF subunit
MVVGLCWIARLLIGPRTARIVVGLCWIARLLIGPRTARIVVGLKNCQVGV